MKNKDVFEKMPWKSVDEYFELGMKYGLWGDMLKQHLKHEMKEEKQVDLTPQGMQGIQRKK